ncbi:metallophosphoesterase, partial [Streptomyces eurythermus]
MAIVFVLVALLVVAVLVTGNWYVWRRLFRDTTAGPGPVRRIGAAVIAGGWLLFIGGMVASRTEAPFTLQRVLAWPGYLWLALTLYLLLALLAGELVRPVLRRVLERRAGAGAPEREPEPEPARHPIPAGRTAEGAAETAEKPADGAVAGGSTAVGVAGAGDGPS